MEKYGFIYLWYDKKRKMYYIGCHWGREDDGYICSSKWMRDAYRYRPQDFKRRVIQKKIERKILFEEEHRWLQMIEDAEMGVRYYNLTKKHFGHWSNIENSNKTVREKLSDASKRLHQDPVYKEKYIEGRKKLPPQTQDQIAKRAASNTGKKRTEETKQKISEAHKGKVMGPLSKEHRQKVSDSLKGNKNPFFGKTHDPELKKRMSEKASLTMRGKRPANIPTGFWWNNGEINKRSKTCPEGNWTKGKVKK
jgi:hypothetical protein